MTATSPVSATPYGTLPPASPLPQRKPVSLPRLAQMRAAGEKITMLTAYDATFAAVADAAGVECILVGDSLGMVCQGLPSTVGVQLDTMAYHTASVARGLPRTALVLGRLLQSAGSTVPQHSPKPTRAAPGFSHQPLITTASPSSRNTRCSPPGNCTGFLPPVVSSINAPA